MMINSKTRFAVDDTDGRVFCYLTGRYYPPTGSQVLPDGQWDMAKVKAAVLAGDSLEGARVTDKVAQCDADFNAAVDAEVAKRVEQIEAEKRHVSPDPPTDPQPPA